MSYIKLQGVSYGYKKDIDVVKNINLDLDKNEITTIVGDNGSGKTTLSKLIMGILKMKKGAIHIDGDEINNLTLSSIGKKVGYLFQNPEVQLFAMTVRDELKFSYELQDTLTRELEKTIDSLLHKFELMDKLDTLVHFLSYGEKQRLALASIMILEPKFLILDEPTTGLDNIRKEILSSYIDEMKDDGVGMMIISHDKKFIERHSDRVITMAGGSIIGDTKKAIN